MGWVGCEDLSPAALFLPPPSLSFFTLKKTVISQAVEFTQVSELEGGIPSLLDGKKRVKVQVQLFSLLRKLTYCHLQGFCTKD